MADPLELIIVLQQDQPKQPRAPNQRCVTNLEEEPQILAADVDIRVAAQRPLQLKRLLPAAKGVHLDLPRYRLWVVAQEDGAGLDRGGHLGAGPLQRVEEPGVHEAGLREAQLARDVAGQPEVGVLVDGAGYEAGDPGRLVFVWAEEEGEGGCEG